MVIIKRFFPEITSDNEQVYFAHLEGVLSAIDEYATLEVTKSPLSYSFRLVPSLPKYNNLLLEELFKFHNMFKIKMNMSKSIKSSATINFKINLEM